MIAVLESCGFKILIVDDSLLNQAVLRNILSPEQTDAGNLPHESGPYIIEVAMSGQEALEKVTPFNPDLILLDIVMPGMSGFDVLAKLKESDDTQAIPVIIISSLSDEANEEKGLRLGAVDYIRKPFVQSIVMARIKTHQAIAKQMRTFENQALYDPLTSLLNRRSFDFHIDRIWGHLVRQKETISLLMIDVDNFKKVNDTYGHDSGDVVLRAVADAISGTLKRASDLLFRWGGEEFTVLLPSTHIDGAMLIAERVRESVSNADMKDACGTEIPRVTVSIGVASMTPCAGSAISELVRQSDKALYAAKESGKNRVCAAS